MKKPVILPSLNNEIELKSDEEERIYLMTILQIKQLLEQNEKITREDLIDLLSNLSNVLMSPN